MNAPILILSLIVWSVPIVLTLGGDWPLEAPSFFRDEGCDESRERRGWLRERLTLLLVWWSCMSSMVFVGLVVL